MERNIIVRVNDLNINCTKKFIKSHFPEFYKASKIQNQFQIKTKSWKGFDELTENIFQGKNYEITNDNIEYFLDLEMQLKSAELQTKINSFYYKRECDENQIDQHPLIQFLVEFSTLIHKFSISNSEDISSQIIKKLNSYPDNKKIHKSTNSANQNGNGSDESDQSDDESEEETPKGTVLSLNKIPVKQLIKLFYYEIVNILFTGFNSIQQLEEHEQKIGLIIKLIKNLDTKSSKKTKDKNKIFLNSFIDYVIKKFSKVKDQKSSINNYRQETFYLVYYLLSNKLIDFSRIFQEKEQLKVYFLEFFAKPKTDDFIKNHPEIFELLKKEDDEKNKKKKSAKVENIDLLSQSIKSGLIQDDKHIVTFLNDDIEQFKKLFNVDDVDLFKFPSEISDLSCLSSINECSLIELAAFFGSQKIFDFLNNLRLDNAIIDPEDLPLYVIAGQHPKIIKSFIDDLDSKEDIYNILSFCIDHHFFDTYKMIMETFGSKLRISCDQINMYMKKCVLRGYYEIIPYFLKEGATTNLLLNIFCKTNNEIGIEYLMQFSNIDVNSEYKEKAPLEYCIDNKNSRTTLMLIKNDFINMLDIDAKSENGEKIIHKACLLGLSKVVSYLLRKFLYDINVQTKDGTCPLHFACLSGDFDTAQVVVTTKKVRIKAKISKGKYRRQTALHFACRSGNEKILSLLLGTTLRQLINYPDFRGRFPIIYAIKKDNPECIKTLLGQEDIDVQVMYKDNNLLQYACLKNCANAFKALVNAGEFDPNQPCSDGNVILLTAIENKNVEMVKTILEKYDKTVDVNIYTWDHKTPLIMACEMSNVDIVKILLKNIKIDCNKPNTSDGNTPFLIAARTGNVDILKLLMTNKKLNIQAKNQDGMSAIHVAFFAQQIEAVKFLIPLFRNNLNDKAGNGETLLQIAYKRNIELAKLLMNQPEVDVNFKYEDGMTPLLIASQEGNLDVVKMLIENEKCDLSVKSNEDKNAFVIAVQNQKLPLVKFFIELYTNNKPNKEEKRTKSKTKSKRVNYVDICNPDSLFIALEMRNKELLTDLITCKYIDINELSSDCTFICELVHQMCSSYHGSFNFSEILDLVLARGDVDINKPSPQYQNQTCLHIACSTGSSSKNIKLVNKFLKIEGIDINKESEIGTPFYLLVKHNAIYFNANTYENRNNRGWGYHPYNEDVQYWGELINNPELDINKGGLPLENGLFRELFEVRSLLERKKNEKPFENLPSYFRKPKRSKVKKKQMEINEEIKINEEKLKNMPTIESPFEVAMDNRNYEIAKALIKFSKLNINNNDNPKKQTPLHLAIGHTNTELINQILERKDLKVNIQNSNGETPLLFAMKNYDSKLADIILNMLNRDDFIEGINIANNDLAVPFMFSVSNPNSAIFDKFISMSNVDFEARDSKNRTALYWLIKKAFQKARNNNSFYSFNYYNNYDRHNNENKENHYNERVEVLLQKCPSLLNVFTDKYKTPLFKAINTIKNNRNSKTDDKLISIILYLLNQADIDISLPEELNPEKEEEDKKDEKENAKTEDGENDNIKFSYGSLLHIACSKQMPDVVEKLIPLTIEYYRVKYPGMSIFAKENSSKNTVLNTACISNDIKTIEIITNFIVDPENGINYNDPNVFDINAESSNKISPLLVICQIIPNNNYSYYYRSLENILSIESLDINLQSSSDKKTALHYACQNTNEKFANLIIEKKFDSIDPNIYDFANRTPLLIAVSNSNPIIIKSLLTLNSLDVNMTTLPELKSALYIATENSNEKIVSFLANDERTDPNIQIKDSKTTALMHSIKRNKFNIFYSILNNEKTDPNIVDYEKLNALHYACKYNFYDSVEPLIAKISEKYDISSFLNIQAKNGLTPLHYACLNNNENIVKLLLNCPMNPNLYDKQGRTPLLISSINKQSKVVSSLLTYPSLDVNLPLLSNNKTPLYFSCENWDDDVFDALISDPRIDPNIPKMPSGKPPIFHTILKLKEKFFGLLLNHEKIDLKVRDKENRTALHFACMKGNLRFIQDIVTKINKHEINDFLNLQTTKGMTPLHYACKSGNADAVLFLLNLALDPTNQIDIKIQNNNGLTPFDFYLDNPTGVIDKNVCDIFLNVYQDAKSTNVNIYDLCAKGHYGILKFIVQNMSFDLNDNNSKDIISLLHFICKNQIVDLLKEILSLDSINVNLVDDELRTPLHYAVIYGNDEEIVQLLIENNRCEINARDNSGCTALHYACKYGKINMINAFSKYEQMHPNSVDVNAQDNSGSTPLHILAKLKQFETQMNEILLKTKCDPNILDNDYNTPLHVACIIQNSLFVSSLIDFSLVDININAINKKYQTPLCIVSMEDDSIIFDILFESKLKDKIDINLTSPIMVAAIKKNTFLYQKLFEMPGIDLTCNKKDSGNDDNYIKEYDFSGINLMHIISSFDSPEFLSEIIDSGKFNVNELTDPDCDYEINGTPLIISLKNNRLDNFDLLLNHYKDELDLALEDGSKKTVVDYCRMHPQREILLQKLHEIDESIDDS